MLSLLSVEAYQPSVAQGALDAGANILNLTGGLMEVGTFERLKAANNTFRH
jgi:dihydropteroate synthase